MYENQNRNLSEMVENECKEFALYSLFNRAMPHLIDGMKPGQRFFMASCIADAKTKFTKIASLAGNVSKFGYQHGEVSAGDAGVLMGSDWTNNYNLVEGRGNFGSRLVSKPAAQRYIYARTHENFFKIFKDLDIVIEHPDNECKIPQFYVPTLPTILLNGVQGIATGFKTTVLPHSVKWVKKATLQYINDNKITGRPVVEFPSFNGTVIDNKDGSYTQVGVYKVITPLTVEVTEIPTKFEWETYLTVLDKLQDDGKIVKYVDGTDSNGFSFTITLKRGTAESKINKLLKLEAPMSQLLNVICPTHDLVKSQLKTYDDANQIIKDFVDWKVIYSLPKRIEHYTKTSQYQYELMNAKIKFINDINSDDTNLIKFIMKCTKIKLSEYLIKQYSINEAQANTLSRIPLYALTKDELAIAKKELTEAKRQIKYWKSATPKSQMIEDLELI